VVQPEGDGLRNGDAVHHDIEGPSRGDRGRAAREEPQLTQQGRAALIPLGDGDGSPSAARGQRGRDADGSAADHQHAPV
jgi:hypothetical protein